MIISNKKFYGTTTVGEKGQVVLPIKLRRDSKICNGEKMSVFVLKHLGFEGICMIKSNLLISVVEKLFGDKLKNIVSKK